MTGPSSPHDPPVPADAPPTEPAPPTDTEPDAASRRALGLTAFSIEGRRAPALFVVGWLAVIAAVGSSFVGLLGVGDLAGTVLWVVALAAFALGLTLLAGSQTFERRAAGAAYAGPSPVLVFLAIVAFAQVAGYAVGFPLQGIGGAIPRPLGNLLAVLVQAVVFVGAVRVLVVGTGALSWRDMGIDRANVVRAIAGGAVLAGPVILVTAVLAVAAVGIAGISPPSPLPPTGTATGLVLHLVAGAVVAPIAEEIVFRGFALTAWRRTAGPRGAIVRSSILFVLAHVLFVGGETADAAIRLAFVGGIVRIPIAFALGWLFVRSGSIWGPIGLHAAFNGILIVLGELALRAGT